MSGELSTDSLPPGTNQSQQDQYWMQAALRLARVAEQQGEVPIGAVIVKDNFCLAEGYNQPILSQDPTAHAEMVAIRQAAQRLGNYRLIDTTLYVTLEPCVMCLGAIVHARIDRVVYAATDSKISLSSPNKRPIDLINSHYFNHRPIIEGGCCADSASELLRTFFQSRR